MTEHQNVKAIREMSDSDTMTPLDMATDDIVWHVIGRAEPYRGKAAVMESWKGSDAEWVGQTTHDVLANDDHAVVLVESTMRRGGRTMTYRTAEIYHLRDGKISERWAFSDDTDAINRFFA